MTVCYYGVKTKENVFWVLIMQIRDVVYIHAGMNFCSELSLSWLCQLSYYYTNIVYRTSTLCGRSYLLRKLLFDTTQCSLVELTKYWFISRKNPKSTHMVCNFFSYERMQYSKCINRFYMGKKHVQEYWITEVLNGQVGRKIQYSFERAVTNW